MGIKERLILVINDLGISGRALSRECGFSTSYFSTIDDGIGADKLNKILSKYPSISAKWLITGEGSMYEEDANHECGKPEKKCISEKDFFEYVQKRDAMHTEILRQNGEMLQLVLKIFNKTNK